MSYITGDIVTRVQQRVRDTSYSAAEIKTYLNDTQNDVFNEYRLPFMETSQNYTLTASVADITNGVGLPTNFVQALDLVLTTSGTQSVLTYRDIRDIERLYSDPTNSVINPPNVPREWYYYAETINVFPLPLAAYTATLRYYKKPTLLSADADIPDLPSEFEELLVAGAAYRVLQVKDNYAQAGIFENKYNELLQKLAVKYSVHQVGTATRMRINRRAVGKQSF